MRKESAYCISSVMNELDTVSSILFAISFMIHFDPTAKS